MAKLTDIFPDLIRPDNGIRFTGEFFETNIFGFNNEQYRFFPLKKPITIRSSMYPHPGQFEVCELYIREDDSMKTAFPEGTEKEGYYVPGWIADYSVLMGKGLYQPKTVRKWFKEQQKRLTAVREPL